MILNNYKKNSIDKKPHFNLSKCGQFYVRILILPKIHNVSLQLMLCFLANL